MRRPSVRRPSVRRPSITQWHPGVAPRLPHLDRAVCVAGGVAVGEAADGEVQVQHWSEQRAAGGRRWAVSYYLLRLHPRSCASTYPARIVPASRGDDERRRAVVEIAAVAVVT